MKGRVDINEHSTIMSPFLIAGLDDEGLKYLKQNETEWTERVYRKYTCLGNGLLTCGTDL